MKKAKIIRKTKPSIEFKDKKLIVFRAELNNHPGSDSNFETSRD